MAGTGEGRGEWVLTGEPRVFERLAGEYLRAEPALHTVPLGLLAGLLAGEARFEGAVVRFGVWRDDGGKVTDAFIWTPPAPPYVSPLGRSAAEALVEAVDADGPVGVNGTVEGARAFADAWLARHPGGSVSESMAKRLYRLDRLTPPEPAPPGRARVATADDRELLARWHGEFMGAAEPGGARDLAWADSRVPYGGATLWETPDGTPVSMAGVTRLVAGTVRVAPVYTPRELRGRGYAGAVTAEVTRAALAAGAEQVVLFTDLANRTSNALYQRLGYRPVRDFTSLGLRP
ncbi:GNAT family N-acetyltransferase [Streptomyces sp. NPDC046939]|uniref:GNAT family N-acetyltransferase n=1 Tax=Streptomyces sp. NPDC046939 TaxID=3155376 RepID=UPI0033DB0B43